MNSSQENSRVAIEYDIPHREKNELSFVFGVLADFSLGQAKHAWESRKFIQVDRENFYDVLKAYAPDAVLELVSQEVCIDQLPMPWLALHRLVHQVATGSQLKIRVLDVSKTELSEDLAHSNVEESHLFRLVCEVEYGMLGGEPFGLLVADVEIDPDQGDLQLLAALAEIASKSATPLVASPSCGFFGVQSFGELTSETLKRIEANEEWIRFREQPSARFVSLVVPRFALMPSVYASASWLFAERVAVSLSRSGWPASIGIDLPQAHAISPHLEVDLGGNQLSQLAKLGLAGLAVHTGSETEKCFEPMPCVHYGYTINEVLCATLFVRTVSLIMQGYIGCFQEPKEVESHIQAWLYRYVAYPNTTASFSRPLRAARVAIHSSEAGMQIELTVQPGYQFDAQVGQELTFLVSCFFI